MADQIAPKEGAHQQVADYTTDARSKDSPPNDTDSIKRVFLRVRNESNDLSDFDLANKYLAYASLPLFETKTWTSPHYFHGGNGGYERIYHIILDINYNAAPLDVKIQDIPHELYRVNFESVVKMAAMIFDPGTLRRVYRDTITTLPRTTLYRKTVDEDMATEPCYLCMESWEIGQDAVRLRCEFPHWTHEACLAKTAFETGGCPTCRTSMLAIDNEIVLECATTDGDLNKVTSLLQQGIQPSPRGFAECTPLLAAAKAGHQEIVRSLLVHGASVSEQDRYQRTALYWASKGGHPKTIAELLSCGAVLSSIPEWGQTLLHLAVESRSTETVALLLDNGSELSARNREGKSALYIAVERRDKQIASLLVGRGAEVNLMDEQGCTPLHYAARRNYGRLTELLLDGGADVTIRDMTGRTVMNWAKEKDCQYGLEALNGEELTPFILFRGNFIEP